MDSKTHKTGQPASGRGFTLIEVMVAVSIGLVLTGIIIVNYNSYNDVQSLKQAALTLKNDLRFMQSKAFAGEKPALGCSQLRGWAISFTASSYTFQPECAEGFVAPARRVDLISGVTFSPVPATFTFGVLTRGTTLSAPTTLTLVSSGRQYRLQVSPGGDVSDLGL